jgi:DNA-binding IclR family transcriptional regulator
MATPKPHEQSVADILEALHLLDKLNGSPCWYRIGVIADRSGYSDSLTIRALHVLLERQLVLCQWGDDRAKRWGLPRRRPLTGSGD